MTFQEHLTLNYKDLYVIMLCNRNTWHDILCSVVVFMLINMNTTRLTITTTLHKYMSLFALNMLSLIIE